MSGQIMLMRFFLQNWIQHAPDRPLLHHGNIFLMSCSIVIVLKRDFSREKKYSTGLRRGKFVTGKNRKFVRGFRDMAELFTEIGWAPYIW